MPHEILPTPAGDEFAAAFIRSGLPVVQPATARTAGEGPHDCIVFQNGLLIDGTGAPMWGPVTIVVQKGMITSLTKSHHAPPPREGARVIECHGQVLTPGFIDCHAHIGAPFHAANGTMPHADYVYALWLAHGVTTIREAGCFNGLTWTKDQQAAAAAGRIAAPRIHPYAAFPATNDYVNILHTPDAARDWVARARDNGAEGVKFFGAPPHVMQAALAECRRLGLRSCCHHSQLAVGRMNARDTAQWGLTSTEHFYGIPEALLERNTVQDFPVDYNYSDEYRRFSTAGTTFDQAARPGSPKWEAALDAFIAAGHTFVPTFNVYDTNRDLMRMRGADWHAVYTDPNLWRYFQPQRGGHGAYWHRWSTRDEVAWRNAFRDWMTFVNAFKARGGRVCVGSDSGFMFQLYGFGYVRELELLLEAGFTPLETIRAATAQGAELLGIDADVGTLEVGKRGDILVHDHNPMEDFKLLYGTGALRLADHTEDAGFVRGLKLVIKDGIIYDTDALLADIARQVRARRAQA
ncbi:amidohydrolase family protein [Gluconacetobacter azotocaptans]|uniref:Amidohydrolase family protein n=1 Tax=Gluconacetobacter azotocaptans TaxID=142834 RepID=A0A7W4JTT7_9PROT|nr:amidohydrolase family protein [Gluconacetobacter azotocaptans]MBB2190796.1 amidohydrolase family protein [Gluconacetobacter azotocaptans]GBQ30809.1 amidohydrolase [Gluconacetobacter azotocaptans DSM 13594]